MDESKFKAYPAGTFLQRTPHFTWAKDREVLIQIIGVRPSGQNVHPAMSFMR